MALWVWCVTCLTHVAVLYALIPDVPSSWCWQNYHVVNSHLLGVICHCELNDHSFSSAIIETMKAKVVKDASADLAYFYCDYKDDDT